MVEAEAAAGVTAAQEAAGPLSEYVIASRLRKNRATHRALLLLRAALFFLFLAYRVQSLLYGTPSCSRAIDNGELESCRFHGELGVVALACEAWFCVIFMLSMVIKWSIVERVTYPDKLLKRIKELPNIDVFVTTADPSKEPPLITMNTVLSVLTIDYPMNKLACYVSDDGGSLLTLWSLKETIAFAKSSWHPFCTKFSSHIEPRAPRAYFSRNGNVEKAMKYGFLHEWHTIKKQYEAFEAKIRSMTVAYSKARDETLERLSNELQGSSISNGDQTIYKSWASNYNTSNHASHCEILSGMPQHNLDEEFPCLVYLSREKLPKKKHHFKAGAMNSLLRVSGIVSNAPFILNLDCDMYVNGSKALLHAMCFFVESKDMEVNDKLGFVQFPQSFEGLDKDDIYGTSMASTMEVWLKGMDGAQGPPYCGTGCVHKREALYGKSPNTNPCQLSSSHGQKLVDMFGSSTSFILSVEDILSCSKHSTPLVDEKALMRECKLLMDSSFEDKTSWGKEVGLIYGSVTEDLLTGMKIHGRGWKSVFYMPYPPQFLGCAPSTGEDALTTRKRWSMGMLEILFSKNTPLLTKCLRGLSHAQRLIYIYVYGFTLTCLPIFTYSLLPGFSILGGYPIFPKVVEPKILMPMSLIMCMYMSNIYESKVVGVGMKQWWNSERMEYIVAISSSILASYEMLKKKVLRLSETTFTITPKDQNVKYIAQSNDYDVDKNDKEPAKVSQESFRVNSTLPIFIPPTVVVIFNIVALMVAFVHIIRSPRMITYWPLAEVACCMWILFMLQPFTKGFFLWARDQSGPNVLPTSIVLHASLLVGILTFFTLYTN
ncbi:hypothetical protein GOP47_0023823 [Adiantum capillus-veneris]|uniref:Uncharacterized protein n=1 Tax=Adiantum capillus-veneris TaxID=13818 RepID=A0A9D4U4F7_ADICA|nr:hypothetical protein GOP47_0023823 [Adiantum capillus-veneris]